MADRYPMTAHSLQELQAKLEHMKVAKRAELSDALRKARAYGDLSENFEYHAAKQAQGILNGQIAELEKQIERAVIVAEDSVEVGTAGMGCTVVVLDLSLDEQWELHLVDAVKADPLSDRVSIQSPVGVALTGARVGDTVEVSTPGGVDKYRVIDVRAGA